MNVELHAIKNIHLKSGALFHLSYSFNQEPSQDTRRMKISDNATLVNWKHSHSFCLSPEMVELFKEGYLSVHLHIHHK